MRSLLLIAALALSACNSDDDDSDQPDNTPESFRYAVTNLTLGGTGRSNKVVINDAGQVAGSNVPYGSEDSRAYLFDGTRMRDLGTLGGATSEAVAINNAGQVVGNSDTGGPIADSAKHAFFYHNDAMLDIDAPDATESEVFALNDLGQAVGYTSTTNGIHAFVYDSPSIQDLGTLGGIESRANAINNLGQIVGFSQTNGYRFSHAFMYELGVMQDLGTLGGDFSSATLINEAGQVAGFSDIDPDPMNTITHAFLYDGDTMTDLGTLGGSASLPADINSSGDVVGSSYYDSSVFLNHAFLYTDSVMTDLGTLGGNASQANAINDQGQVVGESYVSEIVDLSEPQLQHAFLFEGGEMLDLNDYIDPYTGIELYAAQAISNNGSIVVYSNVGHVLLSDRSPLPTVGPITPDPAWFDVTTTIKFSSNFVGKGKSDTHTALWNWGDGSIVESGAVIEQDGKGSVNGSHVYAQPGAYYINLRITDNTGLSTQTSIKIEINREVI